MNLGNFSKADCGRFWIIAATHVDQTKSTEELNNAILLNLGSILDLHLLYYMVDSTSCNQTLLSFFYVPICISLITYSLYVNKHILVNYINIFMF